MEKFILLNAEASNTNTISKNHATFIFRLPHVSRLDRQ